MTDADVPSTWWSFFVSSGQPVWRIVTRVPQSTSITATFLLAFDGAA